MLAKSTIPTNHDCGCDHRPGGGITEDPIDSPSLASNYQCWHFEPYLYDTFTQEYPLPINTMAPPIRMGTCRRLHLGVYEISGSTPGTEDTGIGICNFIELASPPRMYAHKLTYLLD